MQEQLTPLFGDYELLDSGHFEKLERFGRFVTRRPEPQAIWRPSLPDEEWRRADASFLRDARSDERGEWRLRPGVPDRWTVSYPLGGTTLRLRLGLTSFRIAPRVLNLFAYTGGATLAARAAGAETTHVDSVKQVVTWARENMEQSGLDGVRWIVEDALKFVQREVRRGNRYNGIILDPPAYGRGANGEKWILEDNIGEMLECCARLLEPTHAFLVLNLYSMGLSSTLARTAVRQAFGAPREEQWGELCFTDRTGKQLPLGTYYRFTR